MQEKGEDHVISRYIMLEIIWEVTKKKKKNRSKISKEVHKERSPENTILCNKVHVLTARVAEDRLWKLKLE